ncbi:MAG: hypothetical protein K0U98_24280 [Deltaproteobacteria bacterium]|nr:hypothetical protein [Deltaproteobacteria bacterium]
MPYPTSVHQPRELEKGSPIMYNSSRNKKGVGLASALVCAFLCAFLLTPSASAERLEVQLTDDRLKPVSSLVIGESLFVGLNGLEPNSSYQVRLLDESGFMVSYYQLTSDPSGMIEPSALWYDSGVVGCELVSAVPEDPYRYATYREAEERLHGRQFRLVVSATKKGKGKDSERDAAPEEPIATAIVPMTRSEEPRVYLSDATGCPQFGVMTGGEERTRDIYLSAENLPSNESELAIFLIPDQRDCTDGQVLQDVRPEYKEEPQVVRYNGRPSFHQLLWAGEKLLPGNYDVVVRVGGDHRIKKLLPQDQVSHCNDTGGVVQTSMPACPTITDFDIAGRLDQNFGLPFFEFVDVFKEGEQMWGALEPRIIPTGHPGGNYAAFYVQPAGISPTVLDVTEGLEIVRVKYGCPNGCMNASITRIWNVTEQPDEYDVVIDFGATPANSAGEWVEDLTVNADRDFIDRETMAGAWVVRDPTDVGGQTVLSLDYAPDVSDPLDPLWTDISSFFIPSSGNCPSMPAPGTVPLHGIVRYPASAGPHPLVLIVHGNSSPSIANADGYIYLLDLLASHGMVAVSVDESCLNGFVSGEMDARAIVMLRHLQRLRGFNFDSSHPLFNKMDFGRIGLAGHSRGGEAITVSWLFNTTMHNASDPDFFFDFDLSSFYAIAPVDGQIGTSYPGTPVVLGGDATYMLMHGSNDGDVHTFGGQRTYDRAHGVGGGGSAWKSLIFVHGANHNFWNTVWASSDDSGFLSSMSEPTISPADQQAIGSVYISAFFREQLLDADVYLPLFKGDLEFDSLPGAVRVHQYQDPDSIFINHYEEDTNLATGSLAGVTNSESLLTEYTQASFDDQGAPHHLWQDTQGLIAAWISSGSEYVIDLPSSISSDVCDYPFLSFRVGQVYEVFPLLNTPGSNLDFTVQLELTSGPANGIKVSNFDQLPYPVQTSKPGFGDVSKTVMKTVRIPLYSFLVNRINQDLQDIDKIRIRFNRNSSGFIAFDDLQITQ